jgi:quercetin dioxygenase-like cupin family protein
VNRHDPLRSAHQAVSANPNRPATAVIHDSPDARLVVFRLEPGQAVAPHTSTSAVVLQVLEGAGIISGDGVEESVAPGDTVSFEPSELHGMRALNERFCLLATIAPRPGTR